MWKSRTDKLPNTLHTIALNVQRRLEDYAPRSINIYILPSEKQEAPSIMRLPRLQLAVFRYAEPLPQSLMIFRVSSSEEQFICMFSGIPSPPIWRPKTSSNAGGT